MQFCGLPNLPEICAPSQDFDPSCSGLPRVGAGQGRYAGERMWIRSELVFLRRGGGFESIGTDLLPHLLRQWWKHLGTPNLQFLDFATDCNSLQQFSCEPDGCNSLQQFVTTAQL